MLSEHVCLDSICPVIGEGVTISGISFDNPGLVAGAGCSHCSQGGASKVQYNSVSMSPAAATWCLVPAWSQSVAGRDQAGAHTLQSCSEVACSHAGRGEVSPHSVHFNSDFWIQEII